MISLEIDFADALNGVQDYYDNLTPVLDATVAYLADKTPLPYLPIDALDWASKGKLLSVYIADTDEARTLNLQARNKDYATNILSYPAFLPHDVVRQMDTVILGELVLCHSVVQAEAMAQGKPFFHHLAHLLVHGVLHLAGFDHENSELEAERMEQMEIQILHTLGIANPYEG